MELTTRLTEWGIEIKNDTVQEDIVNNNAHEIKYTLLNFLEASQDLAQLISVSEKRDEIRNELEKVRMLVSEV